MFLYQLQPAFIYHRFDAFTWLFTLTGLPQHLRQNTTACMIADALYYATPALVFWASTQSKRWMNISAIAMLVINWCYLQCYPLYGITSIEGYTGWLLMPLLFVVRSPRLFDLLLQGGRYFFLFFFASAGIWKLVQGGLLYPDQMSGVLLYQHKELFTQQPYGLHAKLLWEVTNSGWGYFLYLAATLAEMVFVIGFFTKRFDRWLIAIFLLFLVIDHWLMRIPYYETLPWLITLWFSRRTTANAAFTPLAKP